MKVCFKCLRELPLDEFYRHHRMADGRLSKCRDCTRADVTRNRNANIEKARAYDRSRASLPHRIALRERICEAWRAKHPDWSRAHQRARRGAGDPPQNCEGCGREVKVERHHPDYSKPLLVVWLCKPCHAIADKIRRKLEAV